jgi:transposase-like protein
LVQVVCQCYVEGVSICAVDDVVKALGSQGISKSQVSEMAKALDEVVEAFRNRPLDGGPYTYLWLDALCQKVPEGGRIVNVAVVVATGVNADGQREILRAST